ncbi:biotin carboxyl carrier protein of acetyl-CoA carboxylase 1, chloroplastic-like [Bidens hawaiensis]|uniref:biotin carboxyl carrier protein of acetyl-CoA carboxylase 1, chloroplastic-like n=1 Tax=Bidens hawaiensis TaxID=980011 RepID=UPI00404903C6
MPSNKENCKHVTWWSTQWLYGLIANLGGEWRRGVSLKPPPVLLSLRIQTTIPRTNTAVVLFHSDFKPLLSRSSSAGIQAIKRNQNGGVMKVSAQLNEVDEGKSSVCAAPSENSTKISFFKTTVPDVASITAFMNQVAGLVEHLDSRDIMELQIKQDDFEVIIRKKEALPPPPAPPVVMMQSSQPQPMFHSHLPPPQAAPTTSAPAASASPPALPAPAKPKSSHPPLKCPMAGTFYRAPAPGAPPFVKVNICHCN